MRSGRSGNGRILDNDHRTWGRFNAHVHTKWQGPARPARVAGRESKQHRPREAGCETRDHFSRGHGATWLITTAHFAKDERAGTPEHTAEPKLRQHAVDAIRSFVDVFEEQHASIRWIERERCPQRRDQLCDRAAVKRTLHLAGAKHFKRVGRKFETGAITSQRE